MGQCFEQEVAVDEFWVFFGGVGGVGAILSRRSR